MATFGPLGTVVPDALFADIGLFFDKKQLHEFSLLNHRANRVFKRYRMMTYEKVKIHIGKNKLFIEDNEFNTETIGHEITIDLNKEDPNKKLSLFLSTSHSIDDISWCGYWDDKTLWSASLINRQFIELMLRIKFKKILLQNISFSIDLSLFLKFLNRHGMILKLSLVKLPSTLVNNRTLTQISSFHITPISISDIVVEVTDEFLEEINSSFQINLFVNKFTIRGISAFIEKMQFHGQWRFGILDSDQLQEAVDFEREHPSHNNCFYLTSIDGQKKLGFRVCNSQRYSMDSATYSIDLNITETNQFGMVRIPQNIYGLVTQQAFVKFEKICSNPEDTVELSQYQLEYITFSYYEDLAIYFKLRFAVYPVISITRTEVTPENLHKIVSEILKNCGSINTLCCQNRIELDENLYQLLKPISEHMNIQDAWFYGIRLAPESFKELLQAENGLFGAINYSKSPYLVKDLLPNEVLIIYIKRLFKIDVSLLPIEHTSIGIETLFTDTLLQLISLKTEGFPGEVSLRGYGTKFSAKGIDEFIKTAIIVRSNYQNCFYKMGTIDEDNSEGIARLLEEYEAKEVNYLVTKNIELIDGPSYP